MRTTAIVEVAGQCLPYLGNGIVAVQVNLFILDRFPEALHEDVICYPVPRRHKGFQVFDSCLSESIAGGVRRNFNDLLDFPFKLLRRRPNAAHLRFGIPSLMSFGMDSI